MEPKSRKTCSVSDCAPRGVPFLHRLSRIQLVPFACEPQLWSGSLNPSASARSTSRHQTPWKNYRRREAPPECRRRKLRRFGSKPSTVDIRRHFSFREARFTKRGRYVSCMTNFGNRFQQVKTVTQPVRFAWCHGRPLARGESLFADSRVFSTFVWRRLEPETVLEELGNRGINSQGG